MKRQASSSPGWEDKEEKESLLQTRSPSCSQVSPLCLLSPALEGPSGHLHCFASCLNVRRWDLALTDRAVGSRGLEHEDHTDSLREGFALHPPVPSSEGRTASGPATLLAPSICPWVPVMGGSWPPSTAVMGSLRTPNITPVQLGGQRGCPGKPLQAGPLEDV